MAIEVYEIEVSKGQQFTLRAKTREKYGLKPGKKVQVIDLGKELLLRPEKKGSLKNLVGKFKAGKKMDIAKEHDWILSGLE